MQTGTTPGAGTPWRRQQLLQSGFSWPLAETIANGDDFDLHALIELVEKGCAPDLAVQILAPLEPGGKSL